MPVKYIVKIYKKINDIHKRHANIRYTWLHIQSSLTLTSLSQPQETMMGLLLFGEKRTQETHSLWLSSWGTTQRHVNTTHNTQTWRPSEGGGLTWMVYLHTPNVFHSLMVLSREPDTIWRLSAEKATLNTSLVCPTKRRVVVPLQKKTCNG